MTKEEQIAYSKMVSLLLQREKAIQRMEKELSMARYTIEQMKKLKGKEAKNI